MSDPFKIEGPAVIAFSGGRTSGLMLYRIIEAHGGTLPDDVVPVFCNTGKEHEATLDFVQECAERWNVNIRWVEYRTAELPMDRWREVDYSTASRNGEPFDAVIRCKSYLPNPVTRFCTSELKIKASMRFSAALLAFDELHTRVVGLRADEQNRVARTRERHASGKNSRDGEPCFPLYEAGVRVADVVAFWKSQPFDLRLPVAPDGTTPLGNCDLCFLKSAGKIASIIAMEPHRADWWIRAEQSVAKRSAAYEGESWGTFRKDRPSYATLAAQATMFAEYEDVDTMDCACTD